jgi:ABC-type transporter Mla maintaining outer membrane lipid asymmetry permease subunit MlaE
VPEGKGLSEVISRPSLGTTLAFVAILGINVAALTVADILRFVPHFELRQTCNHIGPGTLVIIGVLSLAATGLITLSLRLWFYEPGRRDVSGANHRPR